MSGMQVTLEESASEESLSQWQRPTRQEETEKGNRRGKFIFYYKDKALTYAVTKHLL